MSREDKMIESRKNTTAKKIKDVKNAVAKLKRNSETLSMSSVCREAKVSRNFVYSNQELRKLIEENSYKKPATRKDYGKGKKNLLDMYREQNRALLLENRKLNEKIEKAQEENFSRSYEELLEAYRQLQLEYNALLAKLNEQIEQEGRDKFPTLAAKNAKRIN